MQKRTINSKRMKDFSSALQAAERSKGTIQNYLHHVQCFADWLGERVVSHEAAPEWKRHLQAHGYRPATVNAMLIALNRFLDCMGWQDCRVRTLKLQRRMFRSAERELSKEEYLHLIETAGAQGKERLALLMETICSTGIRVSELQYITVEAARQGRTDISLKGKIRTILLPGKLCKKLLKYAKKQKTVSGEIFLTRNGTGLSRKQIWAEMKALCKLAGVAASKVFPHNLRHLFAVTFYRVSHDVARLADVLGHSSIETTRIYLISTGTEHEKQLNSLRLIL